MTAELQASARNCLTMVVQKLRSAGWDPINAGIAVVSLDPDPDDAVSEIEVFADLDEDGATDRARRAGADPPRRRSEILWRRSTDPDEPLVVLASNITNDANGDGVPGADVRARLDDPPDADQGADHRAARP